MDSLKILINNESNMIAEHGEKIMKLLERDLKPTNYLKYLVIKNDLFASLNEDITDHCSISTFKEFHDSCRRAYENAAILMLSHVAEQVLPNRSLSFSHSMCDGIYCMFQDDFKADSTSIRKLQKAMSELVEKNVPILPILTGRVEAIRYFQEQGKYDIVALLKFCSLNYITLYSIEGEKYWLPSPCAPETGLINVFELRIFEKGFVFRLPVEGVPEKIQEHFSNQEHLYEIFQESIKWGDILDISYISDINKSIMEGHVSEIIKISEALQEKKISNIADQIAEEKKQLVFIAGPSSSGKTTFTKRLRIQLRVLGFKVIMLSMDDYFKDRSDLEIEQGGNLNFEVLEAIDLDLLNEDLSNLIDGKTINPLKYDFGLGKKVKTDKKIKADKDTIFLLEGIHGINPGLTKNIDNSFKFKIYISALTHLNFTFTNRIPTHDMRLIRRIVRDFRYRNYSAANTIKMWKKVVEGEKKYIFKYQGEADIMFNSSLAYEMSLLKTYAEKILRAVPDDHPSHPESERLLDFLSYFLPIEADEVPPTSILREFIGKSAFNYK